jgi:hypothetical protein
MKIVTLYRCEICGCEYQHEILARKCESSTPPLEFHAGDEVFLLGEPGSSFGPGGRPVKIASLMLFPLLHKEKARLLSVDDKVNVPGHYWIARLRACDEHGVTYEKQLCWLQKVEQIA